MSRELASPAVQRGPGTGPGRLVSDVSCCNATWSLRPGGIRCRVFGHAMTEHCMGTPGAVPAATPRPRAFGYVPIRSLSAGHKPRILAHLLALDASDRY